MRSLIRFALLPLVSVSAALALCQTGVEPGANLPKASSAAEAQTSSAEVKAIPAAIFPDVVARVNGSPILGRDLERIVRSQLAPIGNPRWQDLREDYRAQLVNESLGLLINSKLIYERAVAAGVKVTDAEVKEELGKISSNVKSDAEMNLALANQSTDRESLRKDLAESLAISKYIEENISSKITVAPKEVSEYYSSHTEEFRHPDLVRTSHILIALQSGATPEQESLARQRAEALLTRVEKGEDFSELAKENSMDSSASRGGDVGFLPRGEAAPEYEEAAFSLPVGGSKVVRTQLGYHVVKVTDKKKEGLSTLDEIRAELADFLKSQKARDDLAEEVEQLRAQAKVEILISVGQDTGTASPPVK